MNDNEANKGRDLQQSQSGGDSGEFGGNRQQQQSAQSVTGGYGNAQNQANHQGQQRDPHTARSGEEQGGRGAMFDEAQGGGRSDVETSRSDAEDEGDEAVNDLAIDQREHQDRGQSDVEREETGQDTDRD